MYNIDNMEEALPYISKREKVAKIIAIVCFALLMAALATAIVSDIIILGKLILGFVLAIFMAAVVFFVGFFLMLVSMILVFGFYLVEEVGFWPVTWAETVFKQIIAENKLTTDQLGEIVIVRIVLLAICVLALASIIVAMVLSKKAKKVNEERKQKLTKAFSILSLIFSILGIIVTSGAIVILSLA